MFFSLKNRLIAFIVVLFVLAFGTLSYLLFKESRTVIRSYIESSALEKMEEYGSYVDMVQMQIYDVAFLFSIVIWAKTGIMRSEIRTFRKEKRCWPTSR